ncbi:MAG: hypothetical protein MJ247_04130 [Alphaproteobacteria bacterium]|nr:hypothetical protein [Alphaproteobacteria bacterium]
MNIIKTKLEELNRFWQNETLTAFVLNLGCCSFQCKIESLLGLRVVYNPIFADVLIVSGIINDKNKEVILNVYKQMASPKFVMSVGNCAFNGGVFEDSKGVIKGLKEILPVDVYILGCKDGFSNVSVAISELHNKVLGKDKNEF